MPGRTGSRSWGTSRTYTSSSRSCSPARRAPPRSPSRRVVRLASKSSTGYTRVAVVSAGSFLPGCSACWVEATPRIWSHHIHALKGRWQPVDSMLLVDGRSATARTPVRRTKRMFESAEIGHKIDKATYARELPDLRNALLDAQFDLAESKAFQVIILIGGVDGAGKGETVNVLNAWLDPRHVRTNAMGDPSDEERDRPPMWRF